MDAVLDEARAAVAAGGEPDWKALRDRIRATAPDERSRREALARLERIGAVHRARRLRDPAPPTPAPSTAPAARSLLRTRPTVSGNMDVRRGEGTELSWRHEPGVSSWEVRISERLDPRADYTMRESGELPGERTSIELPLGETPLRVHLLGRDRRGRLVRRAIVSGLTRETWDDRWQRRGSAA